MAFLSLLYSFFLMPIQLVFEIVFGYAYKLTGENTGVAIIALSLAINFLVLPLYRRADVMQEEERLMEQKLRAGVSHIKKSFRGDEKTMILQTYYRQNHYSPLYVLRSAVSLFLEIPFFIVAYRFLSGLDLLQGVSFGPIADLGVPDGLLVIGGLSINVLPIIMTAINVVSTVIFTKGYPLKTKIQLYGMAAFFLVFLYTSPSGLVFYWTLNNLFSLIKTIFYKIKNPRKVLEILMLITGIGLIGLAVYDFNVNGELKRLILLLIAGLCLCAPFAVALLKSKTRFSLPEIKVEPNKKLFLCGAGFLSVLTGILIPSSVVTSSPQEFIILGSNIHPIWYVVNTFLIAAGTFILWMGVFYWLFAPKTKVILERLVLIACGVATVDYLVFGSGFGNISTELIYENELTYTTNQILLNLLLIAAVAAVILLITKWKSGITQGVVAAAIAAIVVMSGVNTVGIYRSVALVDADSAAQGQEDPQLTLSQKGKNVVVLMLDRAMGEYFPFILSEHPELSEKLAGFTYYNNTISFGGSTNFGVPPLFGGYEYTPVEMNKRDSESIESKHNEALKMMPVLFDEEGYDVTVCDMPYAGYKEISDMSIYDDYPDIDTYITQGAVTSPEKRTQLISNRNRSFFCYSLVKVLPTWMQPALYDDGSYRQLNHTAEYFQVDKYLDVLKDLANLTVFSDNEKGGFVMMDNDTTHSRARFTDENFTIPCSTEDAPSIEDSVTANGMTLDLSTDQMKEMYQVNVSALLRVGEWCDYLREQGVYDNTRIIVAADHGFNTQQIEELLLDYDSYRDAASYFPLLLVKDFDGSEFSVSNEFMTHADVPYLATKDIFDSPKNPFTGKEIDNSEKYAHDQLILASDYWRISENNGNTFLPGRWYSIHDSIWDKSNWDIYAEDAVYPLG